jgi:hypothetical protein
MVLAWAAPARMATAMRARRIRFIMMHSSNDCWARGGAAGRRRETALWRALFPNEIKYSNLGGVDKPRRRFFRPWPWPGRGWIIFSFRAVTPGCRPVGHPGHEQAYFFHVRALATSARP